MLNKVRDAVKEADLVLVGIGTEFAESFQEMFEQPFYKKLIDEAQSEDNAEQICQYLKYHYLRKNENSTIISAYNSLADILDGKNYFVVSLCTDDYIYKSKLDQKKIVTPCGGYRAFQCGKECVTDQEPLFYDINVFDELFLSIESSRGELSNIDFPVCAECCRPLWFNQIGTPEYKEEGYLPQWEYYTKWLQGTLNKKLCILELGAGMQYPQIIRFPFEKVTFFNQKALLFRVHSKLYQMTEELKDKGFSIAENPIDFLLKNSFLQDAPVTYIG